MPNLIVCYKYVLDEQDIKITSSLDLDTSRAKKKISEYDKNAIECATKLLETYGGSLTALTYGGKDIKSSLKDALSRGPEKAVWITDDNADKADAYVSANALAAGVNQAGDYDIIVCGDSSSDVCTQQVAARLAAVLGIPVLTNVIAVEMDGTTVKASRRVGDNIEVIAVNGKVVLSILPEAATPRIPSLKQVMAAGKKPNTELKVADLGLAAEKLTPKNTVKGVKGYVMSRKNVIFKDGSAADKVNQLVAALSKESLI